MMDGDHPENDTTPLLDTPGIRKFQMLTGMLQWLCIIGRLDIQFSTTSLNRFNASPRQGHLSRALRVFGYLKKYKNKRIAVDSRPPILKLDDSVVISKEDLAEIRRLYPEAEEEIDPNIPSPKGDELHITGMFDSDLAHDHQTRRSVTGYIIFVGRTPVSWTARRQGSIESSTYGAEFNAMRAATQEIISIRYTLRSFGIPINSPSDMWGDNLGVLQNVTFAASQLKKKHLAISYHLNREAVSAGIIRPRKIASADNHADIFTKALAATPFLYHVHDIML